MATTRGWALKGNIMDAVNYVLDLKHHEAKTNGGIYTACSYEDVSPLLAGYKMKTSSHNYKQKETPGTKKKNVGYHLQFSLAPGEGTPEDCLKMAEEWINTISDGKANYVIAVHTDKASIHAHIIVDSILKDNSFWKIYWKKDKKRFRAAADRICRKYHYSVLEETMEKGRTYFEWMEDHKSDSNRDLLKRVLDKAIDKVASYDDLKLYLEKLGFKVYDNLEKEKSNVFRFTADIKLIEKTIEGDYLIRVPYSKNKVRVEPEYFKWLREGKTAEIKLPIDKEVMHYASDGSYLGFIRTEKLKRSFDDKTRKGRSGLRIKVPGSKRWIRTKFLSEDGSYSLDNIMKRIEENGRYQTDPYIRDFIHGNPNYEETQEFRRSIFQEADVHMNFNNSTIYRSLKQENYFKWKSNEMNKLMDRYKYEDLLEKDRKNIDQLKARKETLSKELKSLYKDIEDLDKKINSMMLDQIEGVLTMTEKELETYIKENKEPLEARKSELKQMIHLYNERIEKVEKAQSQEKKQKRERVIIR